MSPKTTAKEHQKLNTDAFFSELLTGTPVMYGPDPEILDGHRLEPRTSSEQRALGELDDRVSLMVTQSRLEVILEGAKEMLEQIGSAPGAKWGDLTTGLYTASGDLAICTSTGVMVFAAVASPIVKFICKHWMQEPTVGVRPGDVFYHNDAHYGGVHNADQSLFVPIFADGELIAWAGAIIHEGENGSTEPGGFAPSGTSPYDEGLRIPPMKVAEDYVFRRDIVNLFQNNVRDPLMQLIDMRSKLASCMRIEKGVRAIIDESSPRLVVAALRDVLEGTEAEVRRRLAAWPDGVFRGTTFGDTTLQEDRMIKVGVELEKRGEKLTVRTRGTAPALLDRALNSQLPLSKAVVGNDLMNFFWADLPRNAGFVAALDFEIEPGSILAAPATCPTSLSMLSVFYLHSAVHTAMTKMAFASPGEAEITAPWFAMINALFYGGVNQWTSMVANAMTDVNSMGGGAHRRRDGEHAAAPFFAALADYGEMEERETELPVLGLWRGLARDNHGYGRQRGGASVECAYMVYASPMFGFGAAATGAKFPVVGGLFGGYGPPCTPLCVVRPEDGLETAKAVLGGEVEVPRSAEELFRERSIPGEYELLRPTQAADVRAPGELWILRMGGGGGYGDPLERDAEAVVVDLDEGLISERVATEVYGVRRDPRTGAADHEATIAAREEARAARLRRGIPFDQFVEKWRREAPPEGVPFLGEWNWETEGQA